MSDPRIRVDDAIKQMQTWINESPGLAFCNLVVKEWDLCMGGRVQICEVKGGKEEKLAFGDIPQMYEYIHGLLRGAEYGAKVPLASLGIAKHTLLDCVAAIEKLEVEG